MPDLTAKRTLVKSPPELWEELSEVERLAKHLGAFGEITITKLEPEHTVAWEGEHASGTVSIEPSGWGTKVTLRAELPEREEPAPEPDLEPEPDPEPEPEPAAEEPVVEEPAAIVTEPVEAPHEPTAELHEPEPPADPEPAAEKPRRGFWGWLFRSRRAEVPSEAQPIAEPAAEAEPPAPDPEPEPVPEEPAVVVEEPAVVVEEPAPEPDPVAEEPEHAEPVAEEPEQETSADDATLDPERARVILDEALDTLGAAHHRPFSRG